MTKKKPVKTKVREDLREKIRVRKLIEALELHVLGEREMKPTQVSAALALLKKIMPDAAEKTRKAKPEAGARHEDALDALE